MYVIEVTPFTSSIRKTSLTYFHSSDITPGKIVTIPIRKKDVKGLVISSTPAKELRQEIRDSRFEIKKIKGVSKKPLFSQQFINACSKSAEYFATSTGSVIQAITPKQILDESNKYQYVDESRNNNRENAKYIIQAPDDERYGDYKSLIRGQFAKKKSVIFCIPTIEESVFAQEMLSKGIEKQVYVFNSKLSKKKLEERWQDCLNNKKPVLVITTGSYISIPRHDIGYVIIERENSRGYKTYKRPYLDIRRFAEIYAAEIYADFLMGDMLLRAETLWRYDEGEFMERTSVKFRNLSTAKSEIIDMKNERKVIDGKKKLEPILSGKVIDMITKGEKNNEKSLILSSRKGLSPIILCKDCGQIVKCENCSCPVTLYGKKKGSNDPTEEENHFKCRQCLETRSAGEACNNCGSWNLITLGFGVDAVAHELSKYVDKDNIYVLDKERGNTQNKARKIVEEFLENPSGILVGTEMTLLYLKEEIENVYISSIDSMFSIPDFQIQERILNVLLRAKSKARNIFCIQTRNKESELFKHAVTGNIADFYRKEFVDRKKFNYPPFSILIRITGKNAKYEKLQRDFDGIQEYMKPYTLNYYPAFTERVRNQYIIHGLIKLERKSWPDANLIEKLKHLPPQFNIEIDTDSVL